MITERDLQEAIAECQGKRNPDANTCVMLAAFLTIQKEMYGKDEGLTTPGYSYSPPAINVTAYDSDTEFARLVQNDNVDDVIKVMDELMTTLQIVNPRLYAGVMRKLQS